MVRRPELGDLDAMTTNSEIRCFIRGLPLPSPTRAIFHKTRPHFLLTVSLAAMTLRWSRAGTEDMATLSVLDASERALAALSPLSQPVPTRAKLGGPTWRANHPSRWFLVFRPNVIIVGVTPQAGRRTAATYSAFPCRYRVPATHLSPP